MKSKSENWTPNYCIGCGVLINYQTGEPTNEPQSEDTVCLYGNDVKNIENYHKRKSCPDKY